MNDPLEALLSAANVIEYDGTGWEDRYTMDGPQHEALLNAVIAVQQEISRLRKIETAARSVLTVEQQSATTVRADYVREWAQAYDALMALLTP